MRLGKENQRVTLDEFRPILLAMMILLTIFSAIASEREKSREPVRRYFMPVSSEEFGDQRFTGVSQIVEAGEYLYILPDEHEGFIQVYDLAGNYQHSLFFTESMNGAFVMAYEDGLFYVQDETGNVYVFLNGEFQEYVKRETAEERFAHIGFVWRGSTPGYQFRGKDLWRISGGNEALVIHNLLSIDTQSASIVLTALLILGFFWLLAGFLKRRRTSQ